MVILPLVRINDALKVLFGRRLSAHELNLAREESTIKGIFGSTSRYLIFEKSVRVIIEGRKKDLDHHPRRKELMYDMDGNLVHEWIYGEGSVYHSGDYVQRSFDPPASYRGKENYDPEHKESLL